MAYGPDTLERLVALKNRYDPHNPFRPLPSQPQHRTVPGLRPFPVQSDPIRPNSHDPSSSTAE
ncbi:BBE domain-containing protein [Kocuria kalidii]|uniref:BBE domain-containing protein n=1 Tax=Kocuria kalidii TaxID=3376283 RepID=UPI00379BBE86